MYVRTSVQTLGEGEGSPKESVIPFWQEIAPCFWTTSVAKRLFNWVEVLKISYIYIWKISYIYIWKEKLQKNTQLLFCERPKVAFEESSLLCSVLRTWSAHR